ncbi:carboxypeptidase-like regulatory domain-containing protein [Flavobacterium aquariorum]|uniref:Carboxypeptidase-like regulatory domain-containing protein n=1 Tax=Flavobacterium aquariorum TaxID=2217670 RepID=A0A2W7TUE6_9FLAO|nr:DUF5686 family protein [Flavobacterium aquariorum]PZX93891.1 carboxypeptidase-like regulatory domain-containing protein [Flavobacterium aquariorum]
MKYFFLLFFFFTLSLQAQFQVNGIVKDASTQKTLPFASIITNDGSNTISDVDGKFSISSKNKITSITVSYIGYLKNTISTEDNKLFYKITLVEKANQLNEVLVSNANPALAIIEKVIQKKAENNPQKKLKSFEFKSYNKLIVTANPDSINGTIDSVFVTNSYETYLKKLDSTDYKFKQLIKKQHLFQTEKVSKYQYDGKRLKETILGTRMAGFKQPVYEILTFNLQSYSIYDPKYELFETKYKSPIANDALNDYNYKLLDTVAINGRNTYMVYFKNKKEKRAAGLEGILYIDEVNFAVAKAIMRIKGILDISGIHEFQFIPEKYLWFPTATKFKIVKGTNDDDIKILGGTIQFDGDIKEDLTPRKRVESDYIYLLSQTTNFDIQYSTPVAIKKPIVQVEIKDDAINKPESFWVEYRKDSLDSRSEKTYLSLDSISIKKRIESRLNFGRKILTGYLPLKIWDFNLRKIVSYNNYEGLRLGIGGVTNDFFSKKYRLEGYTAYGLRDYNFKYNLGIGARVDKFSNTWVGISYTDDLRDIASTDYVVEKKAFKIYDPRAINFNTFYRYEHWRIAIESKIIPKVESVFALANTFVTPQFEYAYNLNGKSYTTYTMSTATISLKWSPYSNYMQTPSGRVEAEKKFPKFTFQLTQSLPDVLNNDFTYTKIDFKADYQIKYLDGQRTFLLFEAGRAFGDLPLPQLYSNSPNNLNKETIFKRITFAGRNSFETMYFNEFFSSEYMSFQFKHGFNRIYIFNKLKPSLDFVTRMAWGNMKNPENHIGLDFKTLNKGFFESGIELNKIFNGFGLGGYYRYGPNHLSNFKDNIAVKLTFILDLGI